MINIIPMDKIKEYKAEHPVRYYKVIFYKKVPFTSSTPSVSILMSTDGMFSCNKYINGGWMTVTFQYWEYLKTCIGKDVDMIELTGNEVEKFLMLQELIK